MFGILGCHKPHHHNLLKAMWQEVARWKYVKSRGASGEVGANDRGATLSYPVDAQVVSLSLLRGGSVKYFLSIFFSTHFIPLFLFFFIPTFFFLPSSDGIFALERILLAFCSKFVAVRHENAMKIAFHTHTHTHTGKFSYYIFSQQFACSWKMLLLRLLFLLLLGIFVIDLAKL